MIVCTRKRNAIALTFEDALILMLPFLGARSLSWSAFPCVLRRRGV